MKKTRKVKFTIVGGRGTKNTKDLMEEIRRLEHTVSNFGIDEVVFDSNSNPKLKAFDVNAFDIYIFRTGHGKYPRKTERLAMYLFKKGKVIVDEVLAGYFQCDKQAQAALLEKNRIPHPKTFSSQNKEKLLKYLKNAKYPIMIKPVFGRQGRGIEKFDKQEGAIQYIEQQHEDIIIQEYLPIDHDFRVMVVDGVALGAMKKSVIEGDFRSNIALGATAEKAELTNEMKEIAVKAARVMGLEVAGVDLVYYNKEYYVLEINDGPQWQGFKRATGVDPAFDIIKLCLEKYNQNEKGKEKQ